MNPIPPVKERNFLNDGAVNILCIVVIIGSLALYFGCDPPGRREPPPPPLPYEHTRMIGNIERRAEGRGTAEVVILRDTKTGLTCMSVRTPSGRYLFGCSTTFQLQKVGLE